jgi:glycosyltransferase involved in cell wall biosynthesis
MRARHGKTTVSTVVVNTRIDDTVYGPQLAELLRLHRVDLDLSRYVDVEPDDRLSTVMREYLRPSHLKHHPGPDDVNYFAMTAECSDLVDFVSPGQQDYYSTFRDAPFERRFRRLGVSRVVRDTAHKQFVGGCAMPDWWLARDVSAIDRTAVLAGLGLPQTRPTFYHAARLAQNHKGQAELFHAIDAVLREGHEANFVIRCAVASAGGTSTVGDPTFQEVADRYPEHVHLDWTMVDEELLFDHAAVADFCLFPSKFELDGFLITMAEAMSCGAVPIASAQETLSHYRHTRPLADPEATGFAVPRSFRSHDLAMAARLKDGIVEAIRIFHEEPATYRRLSRNSRDLARNYTWERSATARLEHFARAQRGDALAYPYERAITYGWFDRLPDDVWRTHRDAILEAAEARGDADACARLATVDEGTALRLFDAAYRRADFDRCEQLAHLVDPARLRRLRQRCRISAHDGAHWISYRYPHADRIDLVVPDGLSTGVGSGNRHTHPLARDRSRFVASLPPDLADRDLVFLLTLATGRIAWDVTRPTTQNTRFALA